MEGDKSKSVHVQVTTLDTLPISEKIDLIKIDVEGWELEVLRGGLNFLKKNEYPAIIWECCIDRCNRKGSPTEIMYFLKQLGVYRFYKFSNGKDRRLPFHDNVLCLKK